MTTLNLEEDFVPLTEFRNNASPLLKRLREGRSPLVVTHNGRPAAVMLSVSEYQHLLGQIGELKGMVESLADALKGNTIPAKELRLEESDGD